MTWMQQKLRMWLGMLKMEIEIDRLHQMITSLEMELSQKRDQTEPPKSDDTRDIPMEDTPDAHLGAF